MQRLAKVELQSVMHFLDERSILAFARCSRRLHSAADSSFAWRHVRPLRVTLRQLSVAGSSRLSASLLSHAGLTIFWEDWLDSADAELERLPSRITCLWLSRSDGLQPLQRMRLCQMPQMAQLTELYFGMSSLCRSASLACCSHSYSCTHSISMAVI